MILYEDNHILVANKAAGMLTQPTPHDTSDSLEGNLKEYLKKKYKKPGNVFLHAVHRIDRQVSGAVIFAKTSKALSRLNYSMREQKIIKIYHALVEGGMGKVGKKVNLEHYIAHGSMKAKVEKKPRKNLKEASLSYTILRTSYDTSLIEIILETGRYHQIRAQLAYIGSPILGDKKYGAKKKFVHNSVALHSRYVEFSHPIREETLKITADYPPSWKSFLL